MLCEHQLYLSKPLAYFNRCGEPGCNAIICNYCKQDSFMSIPSLAHHMATEHRAELDNVCHLCGMDNKTDYSNSLCEHAV